MVERGTIRPEESLYDELNAERKELGLTWDEYLRHLMDESSLEICIDPEQVEEIATMAADKSVRQLRDEVGRR